MWYGGGEEGAQADLRGNNCSRISEAPPIPPRTTFRLFV